MEIAPTYLRTYVITHVHGGQGKKMLEFDTCAMRRNATNEICNAECCGPLAEPYGHMEYAVQLRTQCHLRAYLRTHVRQSTTHARTCDVCTLTNHSLARVYGNALLIRTYTYARTHVNQPMHQVTQVLTYGAEARLLDVIRGKPCTAPSRSMASPDCITRTYPTASRAALIRT